MMINKKIIILIVIILFLYLSFRYIKREVDKKKYIRDINASGGGISSQGLSEAQMNDILLRIYNDSTFFGEDPQVYDLLLSMSDFELRQLANFYVIQYSNEWGYPTLASFIQNENWYTNDSKIQSVIQRLSSLY